MGLSRRQFTQEFKLAAVRRLEQGVSLGEVARGLEVNPNVLHRWRREFRHGPGNAFPGNGNSAGARGVWRNWNGKLASRLWRSIF
jgi:transposase-like protein